MTIKNFDKHFLNHRNKLTYSYIAKRVVKRI